LTLHYHPGYDAKMILGELRRWNEQHAEPRKKVIAPHANDRDPDRPLRIGYVSADFRQHACAHFLLPLFCHHDRRQFEVTCYADVANPDNMTQRLRDQVQCWHKINGRTDAEVSALIRENQIDILVDLAGHTADNRLQCFAGKPAPIQVTYLGYPNSTGLSAIDYRLTDAHADPPGLTDAFCTEWLIRLPQTFLCFRPSEESPVSSALPALASGQITFGCFNALAKITAEMAGIWSQILRCLPQSRLMLKCRGLSDEDARRRLRELFPDIAADRLVLHDWIDSRRGHLALYDQVDIALDSYPYHGTTTTCEAMWMGVPVITLAGTDHRSRVGVSLMSNVGLPELIAQTPEQYVQIAADLANDLPRLAELRRTLRSRMQASPLMDAPRFARNVEAAYRQMWRTWCETQAGDH
jgi:predicted O-linked N-acetylglucosamine transferase (SPINDLY family)